MKVGSKRPRKEDRSKNGYFWTETIYTRKCINMEYYFNDPLKLYKIAYLQRTLEKGIYNHLRRELENRPGELLETY